MEVKENKLYFKVVFTSLYFVVIVYVVTSKIGNMQIIKGKIDKKCLGSFFEVTRKTEKVETSCPAKDYFITNSIEININVYSYISPKSRKQSC